MKTLLVIFISLYFTACASSGAGTSQSQAVKVESATSAEACSMLASWDRASNLELSPIIARSGSGPGQTGDGMTPMIVLKPDGKVYWLPDFDFNAPQSVPFETQYFPGATVNGVVIPPSTNIAQAHFDNCTLTADVNGDLTVTAASLPNDQLQ